MQHCLSDFVAEPFSGHIKKCCVACAGDHIAHVAGIKAEATLGWLHM